MPADWFEQNAPPNAPQPIDYAALAQQARSAVPAAVDYAALADQARRSAPGASSAPLALMDPNRRPVSAEDFMQPAQPDGSAIGRFLSGAGEMLNPVTLVKGVASAIAHPIDTAGNIGAASVDQGRKALEMARANRYSEAVGHTIGMIPIIGPAAAAAGEQIGSGDVAGGLGKAAGLLAPAAIGAVAPRALNVPALFKNANPVAADAVALADRAGVPLDAATATGNRFVRAIQHVSDRSLGGSMVAGKAAQAQSEGLAALGEQLAAKGYAVPTTAEQAGQAVNDAVLGRVRAHGDFATEAYGELRKVEADPQYAKPVAGPDGSTQLMPLPVDLTKAKAALQPLYDDLSRQSQLTPNALMGDKARALMALDKIMSGPDHAPLSTVDAALGDLKSFARSDVPELRTAGQGAAANTIRQLDAIVQRTAADASPEAIDALKAGRKATIAKYKAADVLDGLNAEPVKTIARLTAPKDAAIEQLRAVAQQAPEQMPQIGRAVLDDLLTKATSEGGFGHGAAVASKWENMGQQTKMLLYKDPNYVQDLDRFFHLAKMMANSPNPSGTAHTLLTAGQGGLLLTNPIAGGAVQLGTAALSALLRSRAGVRLLTKGFKIPLGNKAAGAAWVTDLTAAAGSDDGITIPSGFRASPAPAR